MSTRRSFESVFREFVPDLTQPDRAGWARGRCPYCGAAGAFRCNVRTGQWACLPAPSDHATLVLAEFPPPDRVSDTPCGRRRVALTVADLRAWAARYGYTLPPIVEGV